MTTPDPRTAPEPAPVALITGATGVIGREVAAVLYRRGTRVAAHGRQRRGLARTARRCQHAAPAGDLADRFLPLVTDLRPTGAPEALVKETTRRWGRLDTLIACAGLFPATPFEDMDATHWAEVIEVNLATQVRLVQAALPALRAHQGTVVLFGSEPVTRPVARPDREAYYASKGGIVGFARGLRASLAGSGVEVLVIHPDWTVGDSAFTDPQTQIPASALAPAVVHLLDAARHVGLREVTLSPRQVPGQQ